MLPKLHVLLLGYYMKICCRFTFATSLNDKDKVNAMNTTSTFEHFFSECYLQYQDIIKKYIAARICSLNEAEDLMQDVFVRLWEYRTFVTKETIRSLLFTIARNIVIDWIRRHYKKTDMITYVYHTQEIFGNSTEETICSRELTTLHEQAVSALPAKRRLVYELSFYQEMPCYLIADQLSLSIRTVEGQLLIARKYVRNCLREQYLITG